MTRYLYQREKMLLLSLTGGEDILSKQDSGYYQKRQENLASIGKFLKTLTTDFSSAIKHLADKHASDKNELIKMEKHLRSMMIGEKTTKECQVNELELKWGVENVANLDVIQNEFFDNSMKLRGAGISFDSHAQKIRPNDNLEKLEIESELELKARVPSADQAVSEAEAGTDKATAPQTHTVDELEDKKKKPEVPVFHQEDKRLQVDSWKLPLSMLIFLNNMFNSKTSVKITPWLSLKKTIFEVYELRCQGCAEVEASVGGAYVTMDEFACLYFMHVVSPDQKNGTRRNAEKKMLTFVASLKFYARIWPRAFLFAKLANIVGRAALPGTFKNTNIDEYDVFTQQFFTWAFKLLLSQKEAIKDFSDGYTYLVKPDAQTFAASTLFFLNSQELAKFDTRLQKEIKTVTKAGTKPFDGIDADLLLTMVLDEFVECRAKLLKNLKARYFKQYEVDRGSSWVT